MAKQTINIGASANDGTGDTIRDAFSKVNDNFTELYDQVDTANSVAADASPQLGGDLDVAGYNIVSNTGSGIINILPSTAGYVRLDGITIDGTTLSTESNNTNIILDPQGSGKLISSKIALTGGTIDGVVIGSVTPMAGTFDVLTVNTALQATGGSINAATIGDTTPSTGTFTLVDTAELRADLVVARGNIVPSADNARDLGTTSLKWQTVYANDVNANNINLTGSISGTFIGDVTGNVTGDLTGNVTGDVTGNVTGDLTGNVTGDVTGNVTGDLTGNVTGDVTGNADTATALATARAINGVLFDGSSDITVTAAAGTLSGTELNSSVVDSSLTSVGTLTSLTVAGQVDVSANKIVNVADPVANQDAATKIYVDTKIADLVDGAPAALDTLKEIADSLNNDANIAATLVNGLAEKLDLAGGTMTGALTLAADPTSSLEAATKSYVDTSVSSAVAGAAVINSDDSNVTVEDDGVSDGAVKVTVDGTLMLNVGPANISAEGHRLVNVADPAGAQDAATKKYVDDEIGSLASVAFSGNYSDLINTPTLSVVATSGYFNDLIDKPDLDNFAATSIFAQNINAGLRVATPVALINDYISVGIPSVSSLSLTELRDYGAAGTKLSQLKNVPLEIESLGDVKVQGLTYPKVDGTAGQALVTDGSGVLSWTTIPSLSGFATEAYVDAAVAALVDTAPAALDTLNELAAALGDDANFATTVSTQIGLKANTADLAAVATSGDYNDLANLPTLFSGAYGDLTGTPTLATVATSGSYADLSGAPAIPADVSDLTDTTNLLFSGAYGDLIGAPTLATVATSGAYSDLSGAPAIPADVSDLTDTTNLLFSGDHADLTGIPRFPVYADSTARDAAIPTPALGMVVITNSALEFYNGTAWTAL